MGFAVGGSFVWAIDTPYRNTSYQQPERRAGTAPNNQNKPGKSMWQRATEDPTAFFTFWVAAFTLVLAASTIALWIETRLASKRQVMETRRIGEAQIKAYVDISNAEIFFINLGGGSAYAHPMVRIIATNTGQSPARHFVWNPTVQYISTGIGSGAPHPSLVREFGSNWRDIIGIGIAAGQSHVDGAMIAQMELFQFLEGSSDDGTVLVRLRIQFEFEDVFAKGNTGEAYFAGIFKRMVDRTFKTEWGETQWSGSLGRMHRPNDWPT